MTTTEKPAGADAGDRFEPVASRVDFVALEHDTLRWWGEKDVSTRYRAKNEKSDKRFSFMDGPITAHNPMGVHPPRGRARLLA